MECTLYMAEGCNLKCKYCYQGSEKKNNSVMDVSTARSAIDFIIEKAEKDEDIYITFLGGEPLLNYKVIYEILEYICKHYNRYRNKFKFSITTNGTLLNDEIVLIFKEFNFRVSISLDGRYETQQINREGCTLSMYMTALNGIQYMTKEKIDSSVRMTVTANNVINFHNNIKYFYENGIKKFDVGFDFFAIWTDEHIQCLDNELKNIDNFYLAHEKDEEMRINILDDKLIPHITERKQLYCNAGSEGHFVINCIGEIYPCTYVVGSKEWLIGNITEGIDQDRLWNQIKKSVKNPSPCTECEIAALCIGGQCGFMNYSLSGYLNQPNSVECAIEKMLFIHQRYVISMLKRKKSKRIEELLKIAAEYKIELSEFAKEL